MYARRRGLDAREGRDMSAAPSCKITTGSGNDEQIAAKRGKFTWKGQGHVETLLIEGFMRDMPDTIGITFGVASSVAPIGILGDAAGELVPTPSGDGMPSRGPGEMLNPSTCA
jgi:hypothetical protein